MKVKVSLLGKLRLNGYGQGKSQNGDGTYQLTLSQGSTVQEVIQGMSVPASEVALTMINARKCDVTALVKAGDRVVLAPADVAGFFRHVGLMNLGMNGVCDL